MQFPLKWHGGKQYLAGWVLEHAPEHIHYVEPYAGGLAVLLTKPPGASEVVNDLDGVLTNFWQVLQDPPAFEQLLRRAEATPVSEAAWEDAEAVLTLFQPGMLPQALAAWAFLVQVRQSRQGLRKDFCTLSRTRTRRGMSEQASAWLGAVEGLREAHERLRGVVVLNRPALNVIEQQDGPETWFYLDPPYHPSTRSATSTYGQFEMAHDDHERLLMALGGISGKFTLSGYDCDLYRDAAGTFGWRMETRDVPNHSSSSRQKQRKIECLWMNY